MREPEACGRTPEACENRGPRLGSRSAGIRTRLALAFHAAPHGCPGGGPGSGVGEVPIYLPCPARAAAAPRRVDEDGLDSCRCGRLELATAIRKLDLSVGETVEIKGRHYEVVPDGEGGLAIETPITPVSELDALRGTKVASAEDFERLTADFPADGEG